MADLPLIMTANGPVPTAPTTLLEQLLTTLEAQSPGYTARLPGILIEDISSTDVASLAQCDAARVDTINALTPFGMNAFLLLALGQIKGVNQQAQSNNSVQLIFTGTPGYVVGPGFLVSDGANQYYALDGGIVGATGTSALITFIAAQTGSWAIGAGTVTEIVTSVPSTITLSCTNPNPGTPGAAEQTEASFRAQVLIAMRATAQGMPSFIKTLIGAVDGVDPRLISVQQKAGGLKVIVGGTYDQYAVAYAIYQGAGDPSILSGSTINSVRNNSVSVLDYPDTYIIPWVSPPLQTVTAAVTWNTTVSGFVNTAAIQQRASEALAAYVNTILTGQPLNLLDFQDTFRAAVASILAGPLITRLSFAVSINGIGVSPSTGTTIIPGDSESYFWADPTGVGFTISQG